MPHQELEYPKLAPAAVGRYASRATHALRTIHTIINTSPLLHISYQAEGTPYNTVIPMIGRLGSFDRPSADECEVLDLYLHMHAKHKLALAAAASSKAGAEGIPITAAATHTDGLVLSLTPFSHSVNFRSAVVFGMATVVEDDEERLWAMELLTNGVVPGRWQNTRTPPTKAELTSTAVLRVKITGGSAKIREGGPGEERVDLENEEVVGRVWTGVVPMHVVMGEPVRGGMCSVDGTPMYIEEWRKEMNEDRECAALRAARDVEKKY